MLRGMRTTADAERIGREAANREARLISEAREALKVRDEDRDGLKRELAQLGGFVEQRMLISTPGKFEYLCAIFVKCDGNQASKACSTILYMSSIFAS